jgi:hypothetical protein
MLKQIGVVVTVLLYAVFVLSGLSYILLAMNNIPHLRDIFAVLPVCGWATSVYLFSLAHVCHAAAIFGWVFACQYAFFGIAVVSLMEEIGLRTGLIFGQYYFSPALGGFITNNLPTLVPFLWFSLSYPIFVLTYILLIQQNKYRNTLYCVLFASVLLTAYDLISEPIGILYGNQLWHHAAFVDSATPLQTFVPQPDWAFGLRTARTSIGDPPYTDVDNISSGSSSGVSTGRGNLLYVVKQAVLEALSMPCHYNIPLHVSVSIVTKWRVLFSL